MQNDFNKDTLCVHIPACFDQLRGKDANFEMVTSNTIQPLNLLYQHKIVEQSIAYIFVNTYPDNHDLPLWDDAEGRGEKARQFYEDILQFSHENVKMFKNLSKKEI